MILWIGRGLMGSQDVVGWSYCQPRITCVDLFHETWHLSWKTPSTRMVHLWTEALAEQGSIKKGPLVCQIQESLTSIKKLKQSCWGWGSIFCI